MSGQISVQNVDSLSGLVSNLSKCQNFVWTRDMAYQPKYIKNVSGSGQNLSGCVTWPTKHETLQASMNFTVLKIH
jgi:hypothetical protein